VGDSLIKAIVSVFPPGATPSAAVGVRYPNPRQNWFALITCAVQVVMKRVEIGQDAAPEWAAAGKELFLTG
jgi:hypothetical protein